MAGKRIHGMTPKQRRFADEYLVDHVATQAAIRAGYSKRSAHAQGHDLLKKPEIRAYIEAKEAEIAEQCAVDAGYVLSALQETLERCLQRKPVMVFNREKRSMEQATDENGEGVWQFDSTGANRSAELLGRHLGVFEKDNSQKSQIVIQAPDIELPGGAGETDNSAGGS